MDTQQTIQILEGLKNTLTDSVRGNQAQIDALDVAVQIINGTFATQAIELEKQYQKQIEDLKLQIPPVEITAETIQP